MTSALSRVGYPDYLEMARSQQLQLPAPPKFPTFAELAQVVTTPPPIQKSGLFQQLLGGQTQVLWQDLLKDPDKYEPEVQQLLQEILSGQKSLQALMPEENQLLDRATLDFAQASKTPQPEKDRPPRSQAGEELPDKAIMREAEEGPPLPIPTGADGLDAFWWL